MRKSKPKMIQRRRQQIMHDLREGGIVYQAGVSVGLRGRTTLGLSVEQNTLTQRRRGRRDGIAGRMFFATRYFYFLYWRDANGTDERVDLCDSASLR